ncbi:alpha/beta fold hydrolase [Streptomyces sp. NPDC058548]|uniref:alpha/beta fold hydrolase n=1 Tax=Streptomyces sp. NPDC058548 TaxID=3346545 RepID=UPI003668B154
MTDKASRPTFLLVHGAWHGSWSWDKPASLLRGADRRVHTVDLPSAGGLTGVEADAQAIRAELDRIDGPVVLVAHSYGGIPATQAAAEAGSVSHLVYLAAYQLDVGESLLGFHGASVSPGAEGTHPVPENPVPLFYGDVDRAEAEAAVARLVPHSTKSLVDPLTRAGWHTVPSTYIVCEDDRALLVESQELMAARSGTVHRMASSHSPFLSRPAELAALLTETAAKA